MKSYGQLGYEAFCENIRWLYPTTTTWGKLKAAKRDAWEVAAEAIVIKVKDEYEAKIEELEEHLTRVKNENG